MYKYTNYSEETNNKLAKMIENYNNHNTVPLWLETDNNFYKWLVGFTDAEGSFKYYPRDGKRATFMFVIELHSDDDIVLYSIINRLNLPNKVYYSHKKNVCGINIGNHKHLIDTIIPIFDKYKLLTKKAYDYSIWREALLKYNYSTNREETLLEIIESKKLLNNYNNDNSVYTEFNKEIKDNINLQWFIGFLEGEGNFSIKTQKDATHFILGQHKESIPVMQEIYELISSWDKNCPVTKEELIITKKLHPDKNKVRVIVHKLDFIYWVFIPNLLKYQLQTRKSIDFVQWVIAVYIKKTGVWRYPEGMYMLHFLRANMNSIRYLENYSINKKLINDIFNIKPIHDMNKPHSLNYRVRWKLK